MRATKCKHYKTKNTASKTETPAASRKSRKVVKAASASVAVALVAAAFIVPTTTMAPGVEAYSDSRIASYSVGDISKFSSFIKDNCVEEASVPATQATAAPKTAANENAKTKENDKAKAKSSVSATSSAAKSSAKSTSSKTESKQSATKPAETLTKKVQSSAAQSSKSSQTSQTSQPSQSSQYSKAESSYYEDYYDDSYYDDSYYYDDDSEYDSPSAGSGSYSGGALLDIANPDYSYSPSYVSLSSYDRAKLERLVMGEAGTMGYAGCALVAQAIRDAMNRSRTSSIDRIISEYQYYGSTDIAPNQDVLNAVSFIFDQNGSAVQHRVLCFYIGRSDWHETQPFVIEIGGVRFFDLSV